MVEYIRSTIARRALADDMPIVATISERSDGAKYKALAALLGGQVREETIDPGVDEIVGRFFENGEIPSQCREAIGRWYGDDEITEAMSRRMSRSAPQRLTETPAAGGVMSITYVRKPNVLDVIALGRCFVIACGLVMFRYGRVAIEWHRLSRAGNRHSAGLMAEPIEFPHEQNLDLVRSPGR